MNILLSTYIFYPEPIAMSTIIKDIAVRLSEEGHNVKVVTSKPCRPYEYKLPSEINEDWWNFERIILNSYINPQSDFFGRYKENISFGKHLCNYIETNHKNIDVIYACIFPLFAQKMLVKIANKYNIPVVIHVQDIYPEPFKRTIPIIGGIVYNFLLRIDKFVLRKCTKAIAIAPNLMEYLIATRGLNRAKVEYVYNWQNEKRFINQKAEKQSYQFTFMYLGSLSASADLEYIVESFISADLKNAKLVLAGSGVCKQNLQNLSSENANIEFWDAKSDDVPKIQACADVLILPLKKGIALEAFPSKLPAYLFSGKPVLASVDIESDVAHSIITSGSGWVIEPGNKQKLSKTMQQIAKLPLQNLTEMGEAGFQYSMLNLTTEINLQKITSIITEAAKN